MTTRHTQEPKRMQCGLCARIGTNDTGGPKVHSPGCPKGGPTSAQGWEWLEKVIRSKTPQEREDSLRTLTGCSSGYLTTGWLMSLSIYARVVAEDRHTRGQEDKLEGGQQG